MFPFSETIETERGKGKMKTSLKKLRGFGLHKHEKREHCFQKSLPQIDELAQATQDMQDMKDCYDSLFSAAAATANCAYEFSESLRELGDCLLEKTALNDDEESGKVLLMLGKAQFELQKHLDYYRSHISQTITVPSESLLNELRVVEEMKNQCDDKREIYEYMFSRYKDKGRLRGSKRESFSSDELQTAHGEYEEEATLFVFRMKSLKQGQSRSLLTQAARHHAAQLCLFRKALKSLEGIEPYVKLVTEQQHIDYQFCGLEDDYADDGHSDDEDDNGGLVDDGAEAKGHGELSFDFGKQEVLTSRTSMELDNVDPTFSPVVSADTVKENFDVAPFGDSIFNREIKASSKSAPLFAKKKIDSVERIRQMRPCSSRKLRTYVLPTPVEAHSPISGKSDVQVPQPRRASLSGNTLNLWHSSPLVQRKNETIVGNEKLSGPIISNNTQSVLKESNNSKSIEVPPPLTEGFLSQNPDPHAASDAKKIKRHAFSGPLTGKSKPQQVSGSIVSTGQSQLFSGSLLGTPLPRPLSTPKLSSSAGPHFVSSPKISELHELPRPPPYLASKRQNLIRHSGPLVSKTQDHSATNKSVAFAAVSTLPVPSRSISRSYSIPSSDERKMVHDSKPLETPDLKMVEGNTSPPLMPLSLSNAQPTSTA